MIVLRDIDVYSVCERHLLPFFGRALIAEFMQLVRAPRASVT
jgi:GTP cyclohydrolase I